MRQHDSVDGLEYSSTATQTFIAHAVAGSAAGIAETAVMYPVDTIKTRLQVKSAKTTRRALITSAPKLGLCVMPMVQSSPYPPGHTQAATGVGTAERTLHLTRQLIHTHGFTSLYRGLTPAVLGAGPAHALYYAVYEQTKQALGTRQPGQRPLTVATAGLPSGPYIQQSQSDTMISVL